MEKNIEPPTPLSDESESTPPSPIKEWRPDPTTLFENGPLRLKACRHGYFLFNVSSSKIGQALDQFGEFSESLLQVLLQMVKPGDVVIDVGAHIGTVSIPLANRVGPRGKVYSFEPQRQIFHNLCANLQLNRISHVYPRNVAVGAAPGEITVPDVDYEGGLDQNFDALSLSRGPGSNKVPLITLDSLELPRVKLIKIDVEGMEREVLAGAARTIKRCRPLLHVENNIKNKSATLIRHLFSAGYRLYWHPTKFYSAKNWYGGPEITTGILFDTNIIAIPSELKMSAADLTPVEDEDDTLFKALERKRNPKPQAEQ